MAMGKAKYDDREGSFYKWHEKIKGGKSKYELERIKRNAWSRLRKIEFDIQEIKIIKIDEKTLERCGTFQKNFRNANGTLRRPKVMLSLENLKETEIIKKLNLD